MITEGTRTSEAMGTAIATILAGGYGLSNESDMVKAVSIAAIGFAIGMYSLSRGMRKGGKSDA